MIFLKRSVSVPFIRTPVRWRTMISSPGACIHAGTAENTIILVDRDVGFDIVPHLGCGLLTGEIDRICRADICAGRTAAGALLGVEFDVAFEDLLDCNCLCRTVLRAPGTGAAVVLDNADLSVNLIRDNFAFDGDAFFGTGFDAHLAGITFGLVPYNLTFDLTDFSSKLLVFHRERQG